MYPLIAIPGGWELILVVLVVVMLFGAKKLPELARGTGQALRIFKSETKGLTDNDDEDKSAKDAGSSSRDPSAIDPSRPTEAQRLGEERTDGTSA